MAEGPQKKTPVKPEEILRRWLAMQKIVIADANRAARSGIAKLLSELGASGTNLSMAETYNTAIEHIQAVKPGLVITDFDLGKGSGLNLLQEQRLNNPDSKNSVFMIVTGNTSQSAVAQAAEEDVDTFVLKPYTVEIFRSCLTKAVISKLAPKPYFVEINEGKALLFAGKADEALERFKKAMELDPKPALACFYAGQAENMKKLLDRAEGEYKKGLSFNKIHYKCMVGLFDALMDRKDFTNAYEVVKKISLYFPTNPKRLTTIIRLAVMNHKVEDMEKYHQVFMNLDSRSPELVNYICAGLIVCGKYYLKQNLNSRALELFNKAVISSAGQAKFLREVVYALVDFKNFNEADSYLTRFSSDTRSSADYHAASLYLTAKTVPPSDTVARGRSLLKQEIKDPGIYEIMIEASAHADLKDYAEQLKNEAKKLWPKQAARFDVAHKNGLEALALLPPKKAA